MVSLEVVFRRYRMVELPPAAAIIKGFIRRLAAAWVGGVGREF
jgi:hypothetical protein